MKLPEAVTSTLIGGAHDRGAARVRELAASLFDGQLWASPYPYGNSSGHLVLRLTGNLSTCVGAGLGGTGYMRDREREFTRTAQFPKADVLRDFSESVGRVVKTLKTQTGSSLSTPFPLDRPESQPCLGVFLTCAAHLQHHIGQLIYLQRELLRS